MEQLQLEFDFKEEKKKPRNYVDYDKIYEALEWGPLTFSEIQQLANTTETGTAQVITTLSIKYPIWSPRKGVYKLAEESDYQ